jgi:hypothetical protein
MYELFYYLWEGHNSSFFLMCFGFNHDKNLENALLQQPAGLKNPAQWAMEVMNQFGKANTYPIYIGICIMIIHLIMYLFINHHIHVQVEI